MKQKFITDIPRMLADMKTQGISGKEITRTLKAAIKIDIQEGVRCKICWSPLPCSCCARQLIKYMPKGIED